MTQEISALLTFGFQVKWAALYASSHTSSVSRSLLLTRLRANLIDKPAAQAAILQSLLSAFIVFLRLKRLRSTRSITFSMLSNPCRPLKESKLRHSSLDSHLLCHTYSVIRLMSFNNFSFISLCFLILLRSICYLQRLWTLISKIWLH